MYRRLFLKGLAAACLAPLATVARKLKAKPISTQPQRRAPEPAILKGGPADGTKFDSAAREIHFPTTLKGRLVDGRWCYGVEKYRRTEGRELWNAEARRVYQYVG